MHTEEDFLRLQNENRLLRDNLNSLGDDLKRAFAEFLAPRPQQRPELQIVLRMLASKFGVPSLCDRRECRRGGACQAEDNPPHCRQYWSRSLAGGFADVAAGIELSLRCREQEEADFHAYACERLGLTSEGKAPPKKRSRKIAAA